MVRPMPHPEDAAAARPYHRPAGHRTRGLRTGLAAALALAATGACTTTERALFLTFAGETPGTRTPFVDYAAAPRLGRPPPAAPAGRFRPPADSGAGGAAPGAAPAGDDAVAPALRRVRQALADRDGEFAHRMGALALHARDYLKASEALKLQAGDPLPADDAAFRARMAAARAALDAIGGDLGRLNGLIRRILRDSIAARAVAAAARDRRPSLTAGADGVAAAAAALLAAARKAAGDWLVWAGGQRDALNRLERQVAGATGTDTVVTIPTRPTLIE